MDNTKMVRSMEWNKHKLSLDGFVAKNGTKPTN